MKRLWAGLVTLALLAGMLGLCIGALRAPERTARRFFTAYCAADADTVAALQCREAIVKTLPHRGFADFESWVESVREELESARERRRALCGEGCTAAVKVTATRALSEEELERVTRPYRDGAGVQGFDGGKEVTLEIRWKGAAGAAEAEARAVVLRLEGRWVVDPGGTFLQEG